MKKVLTSVLAIFCFVSLSALGVGIDISGSVNPVGYMNHTITTVYKDGALSAELEDAFSALGSGTLTVGDKKSKQVYNAYALGLDLHISYFYMGLVVGLPSKQINEGLDIAKITTKKPVQSKIGGSVIVDGQFGGGITLLKGKPFNVFVGAGVTVNYIYFKRKMPEGFLLSGLKLTEYRHIMQGGVGVNVALNYFFTKNIGVAFTMSDSVLFLRLMNQHYFAGTTATGRSVRYTLNKNGVSARDNIKRQWANNFTARLGVALKL
ncbi:MAG: hypothetical protein CR988_01390 [Treponema sp.]|nr:MAG: hypothetical protein CR988_01390 [Treponema sp.]